MYLKILFILILMVPLSGFAQQYRTPVAANCILPYAYSKHFADAFSITGNTAAIASVHKLSFGLWGEKSFFLPLGVYQMAAVLPVPSGSFGCTASFLGVSGYREAAAGIAYGRRLGKLDAGIQFNYLRTAMGSYGSAHSANMELGLIMQLTDQFRTGIHIYNPTRSSYLNWKEEKLPVIISMGGGYEVSGKFYLGFQLRKSENEPAGLIAAAHYALTQFLSVRAGMDTRNASFFFGSAYQFEDLRFQFSATVHPYLGVSPAILIHYTKVK